MGAEGAPTRPQIVAQKPSAWSQLFARLQGSELKSDLKDRKPSATSKSRKRI